MAYGGVVMHALEVAISRVSEGAGLAGISSQDSGDLRSVIDEHAIVSITDAEGQITSVSDKFCALSKYSREELVGRRHTMLSSGYHPKEFFGTLWSTITQGGVWHGEIKNRAKD